MQNRIIAVNSNCYHGYTIEEAIMGIAAAGFHYIELTATKGWTEHVFPDLSFERLLQIKDMLEKYQLIPFSMSGHCNLMDAERLDDFVKNIRLASFFNCRYIVSSIGEAHLKNRETSSMPETVKSIRKLIPYLEKYNLMLVLETHGKDYGTGKILGEIVKMVNHPLIKVNFDTANVVFYGNVDPAEDLRSCVQEVAYLHLKEKAGENQEWNFPALGMGKIPFEQIFEILSQNQNDAPFSIEIEFTQAGAKNVTEVNQAVQKSADYLQKHGFVL